MKVTDPLFRIWNCRHAGVRLLF